MKLPIFTSISLLFLMIAGFFKISPIIGSSYAYFSGINVLVPLMGLFGGLFGSFFVLFVRSFIHFVIFKSVSLSSLAFIIPGFCASVYCASSSSLIRLFLPILCMGLFVMHPVGSCVMVYSLYWLIPIVLYFVPKKNIFLECLGSTFVAHAVGSVIWLYTVQMTPALWWGLIPIVAVERLSFAAAMTVVYYVTCRGIQYVKYGLMVVRLSQDNKNISNDNNCIL